jgi:hypothetical protein
MLSSRWWLYFGAWANRLTWRRDIIWGPGDDGWQKASNKSARVKKFGHGFFIFSFLFSSFPMASVDHFCSNQPARCIITTCQLFSCTRGAFAPAKLYVFHAFILLAPYFGTRTSSRMAANVPKFHYTNSVTPVPAENPRIYATKCPIAQCRFPN